MTTTPATRATWAKRRIRRLGIGELLVVAGATAITVSIFMDWAHAHGTWGLWHPAAVGVPVEFLFDYGTTARNPTLVGVLLVGAGACVAGTVLAAWISAFRFLVLLGGLLAVLVAVLYVIQVDAALRAAPPVVQSPDLDFLGVAPFVAAAGGLAAVVGSPLLSRKTRHLTTTRSGASSR